MRGVASHSRTGRVYACSGGALVVDEGEGKEIEVIRSGSYVSIIFANFCQCIESESNVGDHRRWSRETPRVCMHCAHVADGEVGRIRGRPTGENASSSS